MHGKQSGSCRVLATVMRGPSSACLATIVLLLMALSSATPARAVDIADYEEMLASSVAVRDMKWYLKGVGDAYGIANAALSSNGKPPLYCQPPHLALNADNLVDIVRLEMESPMAPNIRQKKVPVELIVLVALQRSFPCPKSAGQIEILK